MFQDLATLAPSAIVCVAFCWGIWALIRHEMAPKRVAREDAEDAKRDALAGDSVPAGGASASGAARAANPTSAPSATGSGEEATASASRRGEL